MFRVFNVCECVCVCFCGRKIESFFLTHTLTPRDTTLLWVRWEEPSEVGLKVFSLLSSCCCLLLVVIFLSSSSSSFDDEETGCDWKCVLWFMSHFFSLSRSSFSLVSLWRENVQIYVLSVRTRRRRFGAHLFLLSRYCSNASIDFTKRFLLMLSFSDEQTINRCRRTSSGAKRNTTKNTERGGDHLHDFFFPGERESGRV